ncbi:hypothetical protein CDEST_03160 [Colletotrichum destructivum]|uniref:Uncharacterized protein n=1 Tax=Colletotrichum destructivum TaxID=34406 RepID=A0AAX4I512_9PEZI|nr:hypothetical protein CDEST_03160 [Colletotrichum destructivum]
MQVVSACFASSSLQYLQQQMGQLILSELSRRAWLGDILAPFNNMLKPATLTDYTSTWRRIFAFVADHIPNEKVCGAMTSFAGPLNQAAVKNVWAAFCMTGAQLLHLGKWNTATESRSRSLRRFYDWTCGLDPFMPRSRRRLRLHRI